MTSPLLSALGIGSTPQKAYVRAGWWEDERLCNCLPPVPRCDRRAVGLLPAWGRRGPGSHRFGTFLQIAPRRWRVWEQGSAPGMA